MRILHVIPSISPKRGGPSFAVRSMAQVIVQYGGEVHLVTTDDDGERRLAVPLSEPIDEDGIMVRYFRRQTQFYTCSWSLTDWLSHHVNEYDLVHIHSLFSYSTLSAAWIAHRRGIPYIIRPLGHLNHWGIQNRRIHLKQVSMHFIERPLLRHATTLHFTCEQERREACEVGIDGPSVVLPLGIDIEQYQNLPTKEAFLSRYPELKGKTLLLFLSRLDPKKGLDLLLPAFAQIYANHSDVTLIIAGSGDPGYVAQMQAQARRLGIEQAIIWVGFVADLEKLSVLASADLFVLPSYSENFGISVVEAMAAGLPVVISDQVGIHHEVTSNKAGLVVSCNIEDLTLALRSMIEDPERRKTMGREGRHLASKMFSLKAMTKGLINMYESVIQTKNGQEI